MAERQGGIFVKSKGKQLSKVLNKPDHSLVFEKMLSPNIQRPFSLIMSCVNIGITSACGIAMEVSMSTDGDGSIPISITKSKIST